MNYYKELRGGRWFELDLKEQLANIGSEVERAILWQDRNEDYRRKAFYRALELLELSLSDKKNRKYSILKELCRLKEVLIDFFYGENTFSSSSYLVRKYFHSFVYITRRRK